MRFRRRQIRSFREFRSESVASEKIDIVSWKGV